MGPPPPALRRSASFTAADSNADTLVNDDKGLSKVESSTLPPKRYSDEGKDQKPSGMLRKKSGFSGFMTSLVGSPKKPLISAPENPVHLTHVGYDSTTGQFTVRSLALSPLLSLFCPRRWRSCLLTDQ
jgi:p21-activated kinase 1